jgi:hypothetical protein
MFSRERTEKEARAAKVLEGLYHKGQDKIWNGKDVLEELLTKHGGVSLDDDKLEALHNIFGVILWGELAAWKISSSLAFDIEPMEAKLAATSQAHDEARHFYVMNDYLNIINYEPGRLNRATEDMLADILETNSLAKKLLGMQLMVEPVAITIFRFVRESGVEPVLCDLLSFYERDEARHIALGVRYLPQIIKELSWSQKVSLLLWQIKLLSLEVDGLRNLEADFEALNINPNEVFAYAEKKQMDALELLATELGIETVIWEPVKKLMSIQKEMAFSKSPSISLVYNVSVMFRRILLGS